MHHMYFLACDNGYFKVYYICLYSYKYDMLYDLTHFSGWGGGGIGSGEKHRYM